MFRRHQHVPNDEEDDESSQNSAPPRASSSNWLVNILRFLNVSAIGVLSAVCTILFIQLQAVSLQVASEQKQTTDIQSQVERQKDLTIVNIAGTFTLLSAIVTMFHMSSHLKSMNQPSIQKKIMAILWMSPVYGITSFLSLLAPSAEGYLGIVKDFYEAYVIYQFLSFLIAVLGKGKREIVVEKLARHAGHLKHPYKWLGCLFHPPPDESDEAMANAVLLECQLLAMQFVFFRPATAIVNFVIDLMRGEDASGFSTPKLIVMLIENISVFLAFSGLLKFYHAVQDDLSWCQPFSKFLTIKGVVFMTFWQGLAIGIIFHASNSNDDSNSKGDDDDGTSVDSDSPYSARSIQHILICMEMLFFSAAHFCVFPAEEWEDGYEVKHGGGMPTMGFDDFASDVNMLIDSGKRSINARRERQSAAATLKDAEHSSFGSLDETTKSDSNNEEISLVESSEVV